MGVKMVNTMAELDQAIKGAGDKPVIIDFYATWCGPCKMIAPKLEAMSNDMPGAVFLKVDVDELGEVAEKYEVSAMPTFVIMKSGAEIARVVGADENKIRETLQANM